MSTKEKNHAHRDPISGEAGAHPVGVGVGAVSAGAATAIAVGALAGPVGVITGAALGAVAGGLAGKTAAESMDPTVEDAYWRKNYTSRPYYMEGVMYEEYQPAYRCGYELAKQHPDKSWSEASANVEANWNKAKDDSSLTWDKAKHAVKDAWDRVTGHDKST